MSKSRARAIWGSVAFFVVGPGLVAGVVPWWLTGWELHRPVSLWWPAQAIGALLVAAGIVVLAHAFARFALEGLGTPMPAAPPNRLVVGGLYRYVRNPMYVALLAIIFGQALIFGQLAPVIYGLSMWCLPALFVRFREEPALVRRFGTDYEAYRRAVPAWIPQLRPWDPESPPGKADN